MNNVSDRMLEELAKDLDEAGVTPDDLHGAMRAVDSAKRGGMDAQEMLNKCAQLPVNGNMVDKMVADFFSTVESQAMTVSSGSSAIPHTERPLDHDTYLASGDNPGMGNAEFVNRNFPHLQPGTVEHQTAVFRRAAAVMRNHMLDNRVHMERMGWTVERIMEHYEHALSTAEEAAKDVIARKMIDAL